MTKKLVALLTALTLLLCASLSFAETETRTLTLQGTGETLGMDGESALPLTGTLTLNLDEMTATVDLLTETEGMTFALLASEASDDPALALMYMMCTVIGVGQVAEAEGGYLVTFAWNYEYMDEATGAMASVPMVLEIPVLEADGVYTATLDYSGIVLELTSAE